MRFSESPSLSRLLKLLPAALIVALGFSVFSAPADAASIVLYKNSLRTADDRGEISQVKDGASCDRGGSASAFRFKVGKKTRECFYRNEVVGRDLEISATGRLFKSTPKRVRSQAYLAVSLRQAGDGSRYQLSIYPSGKRFHLKKIADGRTEMLENGKASAVRGFGEANRLLLRAYNTRSGEARMLAMVNGKRIANLADPRGNQLLGRDATFSIGSRKNATGAAGSFVGLAIRMPDPF